MYWLIRVLKRPGMELLGTWYLDNQGLPSDGAKRAKRFISKEEAEQEVVLRVLADELEQYALTKVLREARDGSPLISETEWMAGTLEKGI